MDLKVIIPSGAIQEIRTPEAFQEVFQVRYLPHLEYRDESVASVLTKKYERATRKGWVTSRQKFLGHYYARGQELPLTIAWIDQKVGYGVFAQDKIPAKRWIGEYTGILRKRRWFKRWENLYCFDYTIGEARSTSYVIDAKDAGNHTRFINHSFTPNVGLVSVDYQEGIHVILYTLQEIGAGEQLLYDYGEEYWTKREKPKLLEIDSGSRCKSSEGEVHVALVEVGGEVREEP